MAFATIMASVAQNARDISPELYAPPRLQASLTLDFARDDFAARSPYKTAPLSLTCTMFPVDSSGAIASC
jgi:hypothetical protein